MRREVELSARLKALADMVTVGNRVCDVGCDHGFLSIYLVQKGISPKVIAMDVRTGPLSRCTEHVAQYDLESYIEMRLSDGLMKTEPGEADAMVCAGMGGRLMQSILSARPEVARSFRELILQPQSELMEFRRFLREQGYRIIEENMIEEEGKFYPMMRVVYVNAASSEKGDSNPGKAISQAVYDRFGEYLLKQAHPVLYRYLLYRKEMLSGIRKNVEGAKEQEKAALRLNEIKEELTDIEMALTYYSCECR